MRAVRRCRRTVMLVAVGLVSWLTLSGCYSYSTLALPWDEEQTGTPTPTATPSATPTPNGTDWWNTSYAYRRFIDIDPAPPAGYSILLTFDHAALAGAGKSLASGDDVRIVAHDATKTVELDRVLEDLTTWDAADTGIWFRVPDDPATLFVYYGNPAATGPPVDPKAVFVFFDGFESGDLSHWTVQSGTNWSVPTGGAFHGTYALAAGTINQQDSWLTANGVNLTDMAVESWWFLDSSSLIDASQGARAQPGAGITQYELNSTSGVGWVVARYLNGTFEPVSGYVGSATANSWFRIATRVVGTRATGRVEDGLSYLNIGVDVGTDLKAGTAGLRSYVVAPGSTLRIDDVRVRMLSNPEPEPTLAAEETTPIVTN